MRFQRPYTLLGLAITSFFSAQVSGLVCLSCQGVRQPRHCHEVTECTQDQYCSVQSYIDQFNDVNYNLQCKSKEYCTVHNMTSRSASTCTQCCNTDLCNAQGCGTPDLPQNTGPICYNCKSLQKGDQCHYIDICDRDEVCYVSETEEFGDFLVDTGCKLKQACHNHDGPGHSSSFIVGRRSVQQSHERSLSHPVCTNCCSNNLCNKNCSSGQANTTIQPSTTIQPYTTPHNPTPSNTTPANGRKLKNFCYFTNWSNKLASFDARFAISDINTTLCTHLIYAFAKIDPRTMKLIPTLRDDDNGQLYNTQGRYYDFNKLKLRSPSLVTLLSVGGMEAASGGFMQVVHSRETMTLFSRNAAVFLRDRNFDGIDIDWEYPGDIYKDNFTALMQVMRDEFDKEAVKVGKPTLVLTISVGVGKDTIDNSYNISVISKLVDYINVWSFDFHGSWSAITSFSDPLFSRASSSKFDQRLSQSWAIDYWISKGAPPEKLVMGMTGTALTFTLPNTTFVGVGAPVLSPGKTGPYLGRASHVTFYRVCEIIFHGAPYSFDDEQKMAFAVYGDQWVGYSNEKSMTEKVKFAYSRNLGGTMFWSMDEDDFQGIYCNRGKYPLITAIYKATEEFAPKL